MRIYGALHEKQMNIHPIYFTIQDFKLHVRSHIGDTTYYPPKQYKPPVVRRPEPLARPSRPIGASPGAARYDYESLINQPQSGGHRGKASFDYSQLLRDYKDPSWEGGPMGNNEDQWMGSAGGRGRGGGRSRSPQRRSRSFRRRSRSPSDEDH